MEMTTLSLSILIFLLFTLVVSAVEEGGTRLDEVAKKRFIEYPHNKVFSEYLEWGDWVYNSTEARTNTNLSIPIPTECDRIQSQALTDGIFIPKHVHGFHLYSTTEARSCLYHNGRA